MQTVRERHSNSGQPSFDEFSRRYEALLRTADVAIRHGLPEYFQDLSKHLGELLEFNFLNYALHDATTDTMRIFTTGEGGPPE